WTCPDLQADDLPDALRGIDAAVRRGDPEEVRSALRRARLGVRGTLRHRVLRAHRLILGLTVLLPDPERELDRLELSSRGEIVDVPGLALPPHPRGEMDLDVIVPRAWHEHLPGGSRDADPVGLRIVFTDGGQSHVPLRDDRAATGPRGSARA